MQSIPDDIVSEHGLLDVANARTIREGIVFFATVGMPSRNLSAKTRLEYGNDLKDFALFLERRGKSDLGHVGLRDLESYQADLDGRGLAPSSRRRKTHTLKTFFAFLSNQGVIVVNIADRLIPPRFARREPRWLSEREYKELLRVCSHEPRDSALIELFLQTGMRLSELAGLTLADIELPTKPTPEPDNVGFARTTRKGGQISQIPLNYKACRALKAWTAVRPACDHDSLFVSKYRTPLSRRAIQASLTRHLAEAGIRGASVHTLRHTMATHHAARGTDIRTLQETLGHAELATTALYVSLAKQAQRRALQEHAL